MICDEIYIDYDRSIILDDEIKLESPKKDFDDFVANCCGILQIKSIPINQFHEKLT